jgi:beta-glucuronidase
MREFIREIDPDRYVSYADDSLQRVDRAEDSAANEADFLMMNQYFGSWTGPKTGLAPALDKIDRLFPAQMLIISEFGTAGIFADTKEEADRLRVQTMREQISEFAKRDWIAGAIFWCYQDYKSHRNLRPGLQEGYVEMGLVNEYRQTRQSYDVWKELNAPAVLKAAWDEHPDAVPRSFTIRVTPNSIGALPAYPLRDYRLTWNVRDARHTVVTHGERLFPELTTAVSVTENLPQLPSDVRQLNLYLRLERPSGLPAVEMVLNWRRLEDGGQTIDQMLNRVGTEAERTNNPR